MVTAYTFDGFAAEGLNSGCYYRNSGQVIRALLGVHSVWVVPAHRT